MSNRPMDTKDKTDLTRRLMSSTGSVEKTRQALHALGTTKSDAAAYLAPYQPATRPVSPTTSPAPQSRTAAFLSGFVTGAQKAAKKR